MLTCTLSGSWWNAPRAVATGDYRWHMCPDLRRSTPDPLTTVGRSRTSCGLSADCGPPQNAPDRVVTPVTSRA